MRSTHHAKVGSSQSRSIRSLLPTLALLLGLAPTAFAQAPGGVVGAELWLKANDNGGVTTDGATVTTWSDQSGNANNATAAAGREPTFFSTTAANLANFNPTLAFDGVNDGDVLTNTTLPVGPTGSIFVVAFEQAQATPSVATTRRPMFATDGDFFTFNSQGRQIALGANNVGDRCNTSLLARSTPQTLARTTITITCTA
ncbi:MAG: hypothetical protein ACR2RB_20520 [Gammaproteobacteria bacterium]